MKRTVLPLLAILMMCASCSKEQEERKYANKVLMLKVDYLTKKFEGGTETSYATTSPGFTITDQYKAPSDFGNVKLRYQEANELLFDGDIIWLGKGTIHYPTKMLAADEFIRVATADFVSHMGAPIQNVFNPAQMPFTDLDYDYVWGSIQNLAKVREYFRNNPTGAIKLFLYTPSVGAGDPADWDWIVFMQN